MPLGPTLLPATKPLQHSPPNSPQGDRLHRTDAFCSLRASGQVSPAGFGFGWMSVEGQSNCGWRFFGDRGAEEHGLEFPQNRRIAQPQQHTIKTI